MKIIGIGNLLRRDDAAGRLLASRIKKDFPALDIIELDGEMTSLMEAWEGVDEAIVIDAIQSESKPGSIYCLDVSEEPLPAFCQQSSTHGFGLAEAIELSRTFASLPQKMTVYGIEAMDLQSGEGLSSAVAQAVDELHQRLKDELSLLK